MAGYKHVSHQNLMAIFILDMQKPYVSTLVLLKNIMESAKEKTVIIISHRLSTTVNADRIIMLENGKVAEIGTHEELMNKNGDYAYMFNLQAEKYTKQ